MFNLFRKESPVYADYAAATPLDPDARAAMMPYLDHADHFANPASIHSFGRDAKKAVEEARTAIARLMHVQDDEIIFTSGGTESNNLAIFGIVGFHQKDKAHIISSKIEHSAVLEPVRYLESHGVHATYLDVDEKGRVDVKKLDREIADHTKLVTLAYANGEIGTTEKIREIGHVIKKHKETKPIFFHTDASQAMSYLKILPNDLGADLLTIDASKIYGPKGVGLLFVKRGTPLQPLMRGGLQERGLRAGTLNVPGIVGMAAALKKADAVREEEGARVKQLRDSLAHMLLHDIPGASINGGEHTLPNFLNICVPDIDAEFLSVRLDKEGVAVSSASACRSISGSGSSYVIEALPGRLDCGRSSLRISLGRFSTRADIEFIAKKLKKLVEA